MKKELIDWSRDVEGLAKLDNFTSENVYLRPSAPFNILKHGGFVCANGLGAGNAILDADPEADAEFFGDGLRLFHHCCRERTGFGKLADVDQRGVGQSADGVEREVAPGFEPDVASDVGENL